MNYAQLRHERMPLWVGFVASAITLLTITGSLSPLPTTIFLLLVALAVLALGGATAIIVQRKERSQWPMWLATFSSALSLGIVVGWPSLRTESHTIADLYRVGPILTLNLTLMLCAFRVGAPPYAALAILFGILLSWQFDIGVGLFAGLTLGLLIAVLNYFVQLFIDHQRELHVVRSNLRERWRLVSIFRFIYLWGPTILLVGVGLYANAAVQNALTDAVYSFDLVHSNGGEGDRDLERDIHLTIEDHRNSALTDFKNEMNAAENNAGVALTEIPGAVSGTLEQLRPKGINRNSACRNAQFKVLGKRITIRGVCHDIVNGINAEIQAVFNRTKAKVEDRVRSKVNQANVSRADAFKEARAAGEEELNRMFNSFDAMTVWIFTAASIYVALSYLLLACALVAAAQMVLGRLAFDASRSPKEEEHTFQLHPGGECHRLDVKAADELVLNDDDLPPTAEWYAWLDIPRHGKDTKMDVCVPQPLGCFLQRLLTGRLLLTRIRLSKEGRNASGKNAPTLSPRVGDFKLVRIKVAKDQQLCFRMRDLAAFGNGVTLKSVYTTYIGAHILYLGSFYCVAQGPGVVVLQSEGSKVYASPKNAEAPVATLLAWDRSHEFALAQQLTIKGVWLDDPSLILRSPAGSAVIDEGSVGYGWFRRLWRLIRYLFLPV